ncbi:MAG: hypothetical protein CMP81_00045 [Fulvimarina sp.]|nr:hypothetical protein [Fulvimarina sp.]
MNGFVEELRDAFSELELEAFAELIPDVGEELSRLAGGAAQIDIDDDLNHPWSLTRLLSLCGYDETNRGRTYQRLTDRFRRFEEPGMIASSTPGRRGGHKCEIIFRDMEAFLVALSYCETEKASKFRRLQAKCTALVFNHLQQRVRALENTNGTLETIASTFRDKNVWSVVVKLRRIEPSSGTRARARLISLCNTLARRDLVEWRQKNLTVGTTSSQYFVDDEALTEALPIIQDWVF